MERVVKVAVIGTGLSGLTAAYLLSSTASPVKFEVHLFEKSNAIGMDAHSVSLPLKANQEWRVNVPMRSFQGGYYPQLIAMYQHLGVRFAQADFSYSFSSFLPSSNTITTKLLYNGASGRKGLSIPSALFSPARRNKNRPFSTRLATWLFTMMMFALLMSEVLLNYLRMIVLSAPFTRPGNLNHMTFREWCKRTRPSSKLSQRIGLDDSWQDFCAQVLVPLFSAVCTAPELSVLDHPVEEFLDYIWLTLFTHHYLVTGGVREVVSRLSSNISGIHLNSEISRIAVDPTNPNLASIECNQSTYHGFSHIVMATQANSAIPILRSYVNSLPAHASTEIRHQICCLESFFYTPNIVINHTDDNLLPPHTRDKRDLNLISIPWEHRAILENANDLCVDMSYTMATQILPQPTTYCSSTTVYQTTNPIMAPKVETILSVARLERAVLTMKGKKALSGLWKAGRKRWWECPVQRESGLGPLQGASAGDGGPRIWICGSYAHCGIPLLEGCVVSGRNVVEKGIFAHERIVAPLSLW